jgi:hypothetical protein
MKVFLHDRRARQQPVGGTGSGRSRWLGYLAALLSRLPRRRARMSRTELERHSHSASTQRMGLRFTERIRETFRHRWLRKSV